MGFSDGFAKVFWTFDRDFRTFWQCSLDFWSSYLDFWTGLFGFLSMVFWTFGKGYVDVICVCNVTVLARQWPLHAFHCSMYWVHSCTAGQSNYDGWVRIWNGWFGLLASLTLVWVAALNFWRVQLNCSAGQPKKGKGFSVVWKCKRDLFAHFL